MRNIASDASPARLQQTFLENCAGTLVRVAARTTRRKFQTKPYDSQTIQAPSHLVVEFIRFKKKWHALLNGSDQTNSNEMKNLLGKEIYTRIKLTTLTVK